MKGRRSVAGPLVSIVTPTLNRVELLEYTLRSVRNQSYPNLEHVVVDGGSTDGTLDLLRRYEGTYSLRWFSKADDGMYQAINRGLHLAEGQIVAYLNSDDLYFPWTVDVVVEAFGERPDADFVYGDAIAVEDSTGWQSLNFQPRFNRDYICRCGFLCQPTVFWRRRVGDEEGGFDESLKYVADCDYWMRTSKRRRFVKVDEFLAIERNHGKTLRAEQMDALWSELASVRGRYVQTYGLGHRVASASHRLRMAITGRAYLAWFLVRSTLRVGAGRGPWSRYRTARPAAIRWHLLPLRLIPGMAARRPRVIEPSRFWLEPPL